MEYHIINCGVTRKLFKDSDVQMCYSYKIFDKFYYSELFYSNVLTRTGRSQMILFLLSCLSWKSLLSYMIVKKSLSKRLFTANNTITMTVKILTFYLLYHSCRHHF